MSRDGSVSAVRAARMALSEPEFGKRRDIVPIPGGDFDLPADMVIEALGFEPEKFAAHHDDLSLTQWDTVAVARSGFATSLPGVYAAGDAVRGASLVVWAVRDGQDAAAEIDRYLKGQAESVAA